MLDVADEYFVGRRDELTRFGALMAELTADGIAGFGRWRPHRRSGRNSGDAKSRVVLVHGLGGSGKSQLLRHFRGMVEGSIQGRPVLARPVRAAWLDWEDERRDDPGSYAGMVGPGLVTVLDAAQKAVTSAFGDNARAAEQAGRAFGEYREGAARMPEYATRFADVLSQSRTSGSPFTSEDAAALVKAAVSAGLVAVGHPVGFLGLTPEQLTAAAHASGHLSAAATHAVTGKKPGEVSPQDYQLVTDPAGELIRRAAAAVRAVADKCPLVILLDTGEVVGDRAWGWLRRVMTRTGPRVAWVIGARFETEADAGTDSPIAQFVRDIGNDHLILMSPTRFDDTMIRSYLEHRQTPRNYTEAEINLISRFTRGLPLAVSFTATLLDQGQSVQETCQEVDDGQPSSVVSRLARRYLVHAEQQTFPAGDPRRDDLTKILGLALAFGDLRKDPELLAALWDIEPAEAQALFEDLPRRHDFVLPASHRLHDDVRDTLRADLLDPFQRARTKQINQRALALLNVRLERMRHRWPSLDEQIAHSAFTTGLLAALWHALWADNQEGLDLFTRILPLLVVADPHTADAAAAMIEHFTVTFNEDQRRDLDLLTETEPSAALDDLLLGRASTMRVARRVKMTLPGLALRSPGPEAHDQIIGEPGDRKVALMVLQADLYAGKLDDVAVRTLQTAADQAASTRLREAIGLQAQEIGTRLLWGQPRTSALTLLGAEAIKLATEMLPRNARAWECYGAALDVLGRPAKAQAAHTRAREIDPGITDAFPPSLDAGPSDPDDPRRDVAADEPTAKGHQLVVGGRYQEALAAYDQAVLVSPDDLTGHKGRAEALRHLGRYEEALAAWDQVLTAAPSDLDATIKRGLALMDLGRIEEALAAEDRAVLLAPRDPAGHKSRAEVLQNLRRYEEALAAWDQAVLLGPNDHSAHKSRAEVLQHLQRHEDALAAWDQAAQLAPDDLTSQKNRGEILQHLRRYEDALAAWDQVLAYEPSNVDAIKNCGFILTAIGRFEEALAAYDKVVLLLPNDPASHKSRGDVLRYLRRYEQALAAYDQALVRDPSHPDAFKNPAIALMALGRYEEALAAHDQALKWCPGALAYENKGIALAVLGYLEPALAQFDAADRLDPEGAGEGRTWAGAILWHLKDPAGARLRFAHVKDRVSGRTPFHTAEMEAIALCGLGQADDAEEHLLNALPMRIPGDVAEPRKIYDLLTDPPLPGINRLRAIIDNDSM